MIGEAPAPDAQPEDERWLTPGVGGVGAASFFSDAGHEITTAVLPSFFTSTLHASAAALGLIEGISDALTGVMKLLTGPLANDPTMRRRLATGGCVGTAIATGAIGLAATAWQVGILRAAAWVSRGVRTPARDSLLASLVPQEAYGRAFGLERAGDNLGAVAGPLLAALLLTWIGIRPGAFAAIAIGIAARESLRSGSTGRSSGRLQLERLRGHGLFRPLVPIALFELGNVATTLLILRSTQLLTHGGRSVAAATSLAILIYAAHNALASVVAIFGGRWIDRAGPRVALATGAGCTCSPTRASPLRRISGRCFCSPSRWPAVGSGSPRPPSQRLSRARCRMICEAADSDCSGHRAGRRFPVVGGSRCALRARVSDGGVRLRGVVDAAVRRSVDDPRATLTEARLSAP